MITCSTSFFGIPTSNNQVFYNPLLAQIDSVVKWSLATENKMFITFNCDRVCMLHHHCLRTESQRNKYKVMLSLLLLEHLASTNTQPLQLPLQRSCSAQNRHCCVNGISMSMPQLSYVCRWPRCKEIIIIIIIMNSVFFCSVKYIYIFF